MIDYRGLLRKYMAHIAMMEGVTFTKSLSKKDFTEEEIKELERISQSV